MLVTITTLWSNHVFLKGVSSVFHVVLFFVLDWKNTGHFYVGYSGINFYYCCNFKYCQNLENRAWSESGIFFLRDCFERQNVQYIAFPPWAPPFGDAFLGGGALPLELDLSLFFGGWDFPLCEEGPDCPDFVILAWLAWDVAVPGFPFLVAFSDFQLNSAERSLEHLTLCDTTLSSWRLTTRAIFLTNLGWGWSFTAGTISLRLVYATSRACNGA